MAKNKHKITPIREYNCMKDEDLIEEVQSLRDGVQHPKLDARDKLTNLGLSTTAVGFGIASLYGFVHALAKDPDQAGFQDVLSGILNVKNRPNKMLGTIPYSQLSTRDFIKLEENANFRSNLNRSTAIFAVVSAVSYLVINQIQKSERSEDNATKHMFGKDELAKRGYMQLPDGNFVKHKWATKLDQERVHQAMEEGFEVTPSRHA